MNKKRIINKIIKIIQTEDGANTFADLFWDNNKKRKYDAKYRQENKDKIKEYKRKYYLKNKDKILKKNKEYAQTESRKEEIKKYQKKYYLKRRQKKNEES